MRLKWDNPRTLLNFYPNKKKKKKKKFKRLFTHIHIFRNQYVISPVLELPWIIYQQT